jgi:spoIIIJ-associated protein
MSAPETDDGLRDQVLDEPDDERESATPEAIAEVAQEFLEGLLKAMGLEAESQGSVQDGRAVIDVSGADLGILIGRRGQTLDALQEVTRTAVQRSDTAPAGARRWRTTPRRWLTGPRSGGPRSSSSR